MALCVQWALGQGQDQPERRDVSITWRFPRHGGNRNRRDNQGRRHVRQLCPGGTGAGQTGRRDRHRGPVPGEKRPM